MKLKLSIFGLFFFSILTINNVDAQEKKASPAAVSAASINGNDISVNYSSPRKKERAIFGALVPFGKIWRTGANNATTISFSKDAIIGGQNINAGKYALFTIPNKDSWKIILNSNSDQWGAYDYKESKNVVTFEVAPETLKTPQENFTITVDKNGSTSLAWDTTKVSFTIK